MLKIECRKCGNCDMENDRCKLYGRDPYKAIKKCAADGFRNYCPFDMVEVVRCKDCVEYNEKLGRCVWWLYDVKPDDFCSYGERKDGEG